MALKSISLALCVALHLFHPLPISQPSASHWNERLVMSSSPDEFSNPSVSIDRQVKARAIALVMGHDSKWSHPFVCSVCMLLVEVGYCLNANKRVVNVLGHVCVLCTGAWPSGRERQSARQRKNEVGDCWGTRGREREREGEREVKRVWKWGRRPSARPCWAHVFLFVCLCVEEWLVSHIHNNVCLLLQLLHNLPILSQSLFFFFTWLRCKGTLCFCEHFTVQWKQVTVVLFYFWKGVACDTVFLWGCHNTCFGHKIVLWSAHIPVGWFWNLSRDRNWQFGENQLSNK